MARPKEFDRDTALRSAMAVFAEHGYEGSSTDALLRAMGISRQSMYDTFGDKRRLYLEALQRYVADSVAVRIGALNGAGSALQGLEAMLNGFAAESEPGAAPSCLGISAICEFGRSDPEVGMLTDMAGKTVLSALERRIAEGIAAGDIDADVNAQAAAHFMMATLSGLKIAARGGASQENLRDIVRMAMRGLT